MAIRKKIRISAAIPTSSMADIAFLLIVFFLVTTSMNSDKGLSLTLSPPGSVRRVPRKNLTQVSVNADGVILHDEKQVTLEEMGQRIEFLTSRNPELIVSIRTASDARYELFVDVVDKVKRAGNERIAIAKPD